MKTARKLANAIRILTIDAVQKANSGHPGMPLGMADIAEVLWNKFLVHNPNNPRWLNRDRFVLSNGHGSMLQYAVLHLTGYDISLQDLQQFRQLHSKTPGHPEYGVTPGVEITTGPLAQGLAGAVGMALAEQLLANEFNQDNYQIIDHYTYCFVGDGCLMEGLSHEVCSLAGNLKLNKLIVFWDDNGISIDGKVQGWFNENIPMRFRAYNWQVISDVDGHDAMAIEQAIKQAKHNQQQPTLICCKTVIGFGAPTVAGTANCHGAPLGEVEIQATRKNLAWPITTTFEIPEEIYQAWDARKQGAIVEAEWQQIFVKYQQEYPILAAELLRRYQGELPVTWQEKITTIIDKLQQDNLSIGTRNASQQILEQLALILPELFGGSADLSGSNLTIHKNSIPINSKSQLNGNYLYYGVREFAMAGIMNGVALHQGFIPYGGTFLTFIDYARSALRLSAIMQQRVIYVLTHDSIGVGEDGPTHQPIEHLAMLRLTPNVVLWRPCDAVETAIAWQMAIERKNGPTVLALTRQKVIGQARTTAQVEVIKKGGYILDDADNLTEKALILIATGSEVTLAMAAKKLLQSDGYAVRVVSMPAVEIFVKQPKEYQDLVLPNSIPKIAIEAGVTAPWYKLVGINGKVIGIDSFGYSAPANVVYEEVGLTVENIVAAAKSI